MIILNIRGTNGSGKSTIVRTVKERAGELDILTSPRRRHPVAYITRHPLPPLAILGHYETETGGCDTIGSMDQVYGMIRHFSDHGLHVLFEGIMVSGERHRAIDLHKDGYPLHVIGLTTSVEECINAVDERQERAGKFGDLNTDRLINRYDEVVRMIKHLNAAGVRTLWLSREESLKEALKLIGEK